MSPRDADAVTPAGTPPAARQDPTCRASPCHAACPETLPAPCTAASPQFEVTAGCAGCPGHSSLAVLGLGVQHGVGSPCRGTYSCLHRSITQLAPSISFDLRGITPVQQPGRTRSVFPFIVTLREPIKPTASAGCGWRAPAGRAACVLLFSARPCWRGAEPACPPHPLGT